jgi:hypothetical protein
MDRMMSRHMPRADVSALMIFLDSYSVRLSKAYRAKLDILGSGFDSLCSVDLAIGRGCDQTPAQGWSSS